MASNLQQRDRRIDRSTALTERALETIPDATQTNSKSPREYVRGVAPTYLERADGSHVWDVDGNEYIDYVMALGPVNLGYNYPPVKQAVEDQLDQGSMFTLSHPVEIDVAERLVEHVPSAEKVRFLKNGNDATTLAAKLARAYTDRDVVATHGYHGWTDVWQAGSHSRGIPDAVGDYTARFDYNDIESLERIFEAHPGDVAGIVMTPVKFDAPEDDFLEQVREIADREDALLVFDEILTGFRFGLGGAQEYFGVTPDLTCFAKAMANGYPVSALVGRSDVMDVITDDDFVYSMTYAGETLSLAAAKAAIDVMVDEDVTEHVWRQGETLSTGYNDLVAEFDLESYTECQGIPGPLTGISFSGDDDVSTNLLKSLFQQECIERGVLFGRQLVSYSHSDEDIAYTLDVYEQALETLAAGIRAGDVKDRLHGEPIGTSFSDVTNAQ